MFRIGQTVYSSNNNEIGIIVGINEQYDESPNWYYVQFEGETIQEAECRSCPESSLTHVSNKEEP